MDPQNVYAATTRPAPTARSLRSSLNYRSLKNDKDFELVVCVEDEGLAQEVLTRVRDVDIRASKHFTPRDVRGLHGRLRVRNRDPRTLFLLSRKVL